MPHKYVPIDEQTTQYGYTWEAHEQPYYTAQARPVVTEELEQESIQWTWRGLGFAVFIFLASFCIGFITCFVWVSSLR